jgi:ligand-binding sensor domain-containing protein
MLNDALNFRWMQPGTEKGYLKGRVLRTMIETEPDMLWVSTEGDGLLKINLKTGESQTFTNIPNLGKNIHSLYYDKEKQILWIGTFRNGLFLYNLKTGATRRYLRERGLDSDAIFYIARQKNGRIWLATTQGLRYYDKATDTFVKTGDVQLDNRFVYTLCVDHNDNVWAGMADVGLYRIDGKSGKITHWKKGQNGLNDNYITCLFEDSRGTMFIGTNISGLQFIRQQDADQIQAIGKGWLMPHYTICSIAEDGDHCLWVSTNQGLIKIDIKNERITRYTTDNGLPTNQFNFSSSLVGHDGRLYFGTVQGMVSFLSSQLKASNR